MHHRIVDMEELNVLRKNGGIGLIQQVLNDKRTIIGFKKYLDTKTHWMLQLVNKYSIPKKIFH